MLSQVQLIYILAFTFVPKILKMRLLWIALKLFSKCSHPNPVSYNIGKLLILVGLEPSLKIYAVLTSHKKWGNYMTIFTSFMYFA
jgi:hypothetical protein